MTEAEREALRSLCMLADVILRGLSDGLGTDEWKQLQGEWLEATDELRQQLADEDREREQSDG